MDTTIALILPARTDNTYSHLRISNILTYLLAVLFWLQSNSLAIAQTDEDSALSGIIKGTGYSNTPNVDSCCQLITKYITLLINAQQDAKACDSLLDSIWVYYDRLDKRPDFRQVPINKALDSLVKLCNYPLARTICGFLLKRDITSCLSYFYLITIYSRESEESDRQMHEAFYFPDTSYDGIINVYEAYLRNCNIRSISEEMKNRVNDFMLKEGDDIARHKLEDAIRMYESGNTSAAIDSFKCAVKYAKSLEEPAYNLGVIYLQLKHTDSAKVCFKELVDNNCKMIEPYVRLGEIYLGHGHPKEAAADFAIVEAKITSDTSQHVDSLYYYNYGLALLKSERYPEARAKFTQVIAGDKEFCDALYNLAGVCLRLGEYKCAQENLRKACDCWEINCRTMINSMIGETAEQKQQAADSSR